MISSLANDMNPPAPYQQSPKARKTAASFAGYRKRQTLLAGYFPRRISLPTEPWIPSHVVQICSAGDCGGFLSPPGWMAEWSHNDLWVYDSAELAWSVVPMHRRADFEVHAYRLFLARFVDGHEEPLERPPIEAQPVPADWELLGYDAVSNPGLGARRLDLAKQFTHSSLSPFCNGLCAEIRVNRFCLLDEPTEAFRRAREFSAGGGEPEPYVVVEVRRRMR